MHPTITCWNIIKKGGSFLVYTDWKENQCFNWHTFITVLFYDSDYYQIKLTCLYHVLLTGRLLFTLPILELSHLHENLATCPTRPNKTVFDVTTDAKDNQWMTIALFIRIQMCHQFIASLTMSQRLPWTVCVLGPQPSGWPSAQRTLSDRRRRSPHYSLKAHNFKLWTLGLLK